MEHTEKWLVDLQNMECRNRHNQMVISFEKKGLALLGKIKYIPDDLLEKSQIHSDTRTHIRKEFIEADKIFFREYFREK